MPPVHTWHLWVDGSFTPAREPTTRSPGGGARAGWAFVINAQLSQAPHFDNVVVGIAAGPLDEVWLEMFHVPMLSSEFAEAAAIHFAVLWALTVAEPVVIHYDSTLAGHAADGTASASEFAESVARTMRGLVRLRERRRGGVVLSTFIRIRDTQ